MQLPQGIAYKTFLQRCHFYEKIYIFQQCKSSSVLILYTCNIYTSIIMYDDNSPVGTVGKI